MRFRKVSAESISATWPHLFIASVIVASAPAQGDEAVPTKAYEAGYTFRACKESFCPELVVVMPGRFVMGAPEGEIVELPKTSRWEPYKPSVERPQHEVTIEKPLAIGKYEVTYEEWDACVADGGCNGHVPDDEAWGRSRRPVNNLSWQDAKAYTEWLSAKTGRTYRLPTEAEWEYAARAGSAAAYSWGDELGDTRANCRTCGSEWDGKETAPVGSFPANAFGLHDMNGNLWEWVEDCWAESYEGAPTDGSAVLVGDCEKRVLRGGSWNFAATFLRSARRFWNTDDTRYYDNGFRIVRTLD